MLDINPYLLVITLYYGLMFQMKEKDLKIFQIDKLHIQYVQGD